MAVNNIASVGGLDSDLEYTKNELVQYPSSLKFVSETKMDVTSVLRILAHIHNTDGDTENLALALLSEMLPMCTYKAIKIAYVEEMEKIT